MLLWLVQEEEKWVLEGTLVVFVIWRELKNNISRGAHSYPPPCCPSSSGCTSELHIHSASGTQTCYQAGLVIPSYSCIPNEADCCPFPQTTVVTQFWVILLPAWATHLPNSLPPPVLSSPSYCRKQPHLMSHCSGNFQYLEQCIQTPMSPDTLYSRFPISFISLSSFHCCPGIPLCAAASCHLRACFPRELSSASIQVCLPSPMSLPPILRQASIEIFIECFNKIL